MTSASVWTSSENSADQVDGSRNPRARRRIKRAAIAPKILAKLNLMLFKPLLRAKCATIDSELVFFLPAYLASVALVAVCIQIYTGS